MAQGNGSVFTGHRGRPFVTIIEISSHSRLKFNVTMRDNASCKIQIADEQVVNPIREPKTLKLMWFNAAQPTPGVLNSRFPFRDYLLGIIQSENPDVLFFSCTGYAYSRLEIEDLMKRNLGHSLFFQADLGNDGGCFVLSGTGNGNAAVSRRSGCDITSGVEFNYAWN